jgi:hypothetical protein
MSFHLGRVADGEARIQRDFTEFAMLWANVREDWLDDRCRKFEQEHLFTLGPSLSRFSRTLHEFCDAVRKADIELKDDRAVSDGLN